MSRLLVVLVSMLLGQAALAESTAAWHSIRLRWSAGEIPEGECPAGVFEIRRDGRFKFEECDKMLTGPMKADDLKVVTRLADGLVSELETALVCDDDEVADYSEDVMILAKGSQTFRTVFRFGEGPTCHRGNREKAEEFRDAISSIMGRYSKL